MGGRGGKVGGGGGAGRPTRHEFQNNADRTRLPPLRADKAAFMEMTAEELLHVNLYTISSSLANERTKWSRDTKELLEFEGIFGIKNQSSLDAFLSHHRKMLDKAITKGRNETMTVYRGLQGANSDKILAFAIANPGGKMKLDGFQSSSRQPSIAASFTSTKNPIVLEIVTRSGLRIGRQSSKRHEQEILLPRDRSYTINRVIKNVQYNRAQTFGRATVTVIQITAD